MAMSRYKPGSDPRGGHVRLYWDVVDSNAWRCLSATDQRAYIALQRQLRSTNNGDLSLPLSVARTHGIASPATLAKSLRALCAVGLLAVTRKGGCTRGGQRLATLYRFTDHNAYEVPAKHLAEFKPSNEWRNVKTLAQGRDLMRQAEAKAAKKEASRKKIPLQSLVVTASNNEAVKPLTTSNNEAWPSEPLQILKQEKTIRNGRKANNGAGFGNPDDALDSESHTSNIEVLSTRYQVGALTPVLVGMGMKRFVGRAGRSGKPKKAQPAQHINTSDCASLRAADVGVGVSWAR
jgi:hypothetical protein